MPGSTDVVKGSRVDGAHGLAALTVVEAAHRAAAERAWVTIDAILEAA